MDGEDSAHLITDARAEEGGRREGGEPFFAPTLPSLPRLQKRGLIVGRPDLWEIIMRRLICERGKDACFAAASTICYSGHNSVGKEKNRKRPWGGRILVHPMCCRHKSPVCIQWGFHPLLCGPAVFACHSSPESPRYNNHQTQNKEGRNKKAFQSFQKKEKIKCSRIVMTIVQSHTGVSP